jgi:hypothetical protein
MAGPLHSCAYLGRSAVDAEARRVGLETAGGVTTAGPAANPRFFSGFVAGARPAAAGLLAVADVAHARYWQPQVAALRDPVVTCNGDRLRFESFSGCCGV